MAKHGTIGPFSGEAEDWSAYTEALEHYFIANEITEAPKKKSILLSVCGTPTYKLIRSLAAPTKPGDMTYDDLVKLVLEYYQPQKSVIVERFKFNSRNRRSGESVAQFVAELRRLSEYCEFGRMLDDMIRDRLVCGINDTKIQERLLVEPQLTLTKATKLAQSMEFAEKDAADISTAQGTASTESVNQLAWAKDDNPAVECYRCKGPHMAPKCPFKDSTCHGCGKRGHILKACRSRKKSESRASTKKGMHHVNVEETGKYQEYGMFNLSSDRTNPIEVTILIEQKSVVMEVDTGASLTVISENTFKQFEKPLQQATLRLLTYTKEQIPVLGSCLVLVSHNGKTFTLPVIVVPGNGPNLLGRDWLTHLKLDWRTIFSTTQTTVSHILNEFNEVFDDNLGELKGFTAKLQVDPQARPVFCKPRQVPLMMKQKIDIELTRLERDGIIQPVQFSNWAAPVVPVVKPDGSLRLCGDYKITINKAVLTETYPLPKIDELFSVLSGGKSFSKLDLSHAYLQIKLDDSSKELVTINTHKGLYQYNRLPFGVSSAPAIFQRAIENLLQGLPKVCVYIDDILVTGETEQEHLENLTAVLKRLKDAGMRLKKDKCKFLISEVEYLGHVINAQGLKPSGSKITAITDAPVPSNVTELKSFLGLVNYYGKFLPNLATQLCPLYQLLNKKTRWSWGQPQNDAFNKVKDAVKSASLLVHFDSSLPLILSCDASPYGVGAILSHQMPDQTEKPIAFASRTLAPAEKNYSQLDKETLAILFGVKKFHTYLYGRRFVIQTDHKPITYLLDSAKPVPTMASPRMQRWALTLSGYNYTIMFRKGTEQAHADALSRLPLPHQPDSVPVPSETVFLMEHLSFTPVSAAQIKVWTNQDPVLSKVKHSLWAGEPLPVIEVTEPYRRRQSELSLEDGCILWGNRVVLPPQARSKMITELHMGHPGIAKMKNLARRYVWWPNMDSALEECVKGCITCQTSQKLPSQAPLHPWEWPEKAWSRVHIDYAGPFMGRMFLVIIDAYSKWLEVYVMNSATTAATIEKLRDTFARYGLPDVLVSDNATCFTSDEFQQFLKANGIRHAKSAPYHPTTNGLAERAVQTVKQSLKKAKEGSLETKLSRSLFRYRLTPHSTTGVSPSELMFGRRLRSQLDFVVPSVRSRVTHQQSRQKESHDYHAKDREFVIGDQVLAKNYTHGNPKWVSGEISAVKGPVSYEVKLEDGRVVHRHLDQIRTGIASTHVDTPEMPMLNDNSQDTDKEPRHSKRSIKPPARFQKT